jgi:undecaprenyl diphosphate synthase
LQQPPSQPAPILLRPEQLPRHIAVVMDGNGRWAKGRGLSRSEGHAAGVESIHRIIRSCRRLGVPFLTLYAFSAQNWGRPRDEVRALMALLIDFVHTDCQELIANGVRLLVNGDMARLPAMARDGLQRLIDISAGNTGLTLVLCLSYGGREEIASAVAAACRDAMAGRLDPASLTPATFRRYLPHPDVPDPDLLIRTSGELRVSNFLLWQIAYTELHVTPVLWPDFSDRHLLEALAAYAQRERRFGKTGDQVQAKPTPAAADAAAAAAPAGTGADSAAAMSMPAGSVPTLPLAVIAADRHTSTAPALLEHQPSAADVLDALQDMQREPSLESPGHRAAARRGGSGSGPAASRRGGGACCRSWRIALQCAYTHGLGSVFSIQTAHGFAAVLSPRRAAGAGSSDALTPKMAATFAAGSSPKALGGVSGLEAADAQKAAAGARGGWLQLLPMLALLCCLCSLSSSLSPAAVLGAGASSLLSFFSLPSVFGVPLHAMADGA